jgi:predicted enzyme related to lactoylglutathione lyase
MRRMQINHQVVVFDTADLAAESRFWAGVLAGTVSEDDDWHMVRVDGAPKIGVQLAPAHVAPEWPEGQPQQVHLDLWVADPEEAHEQVTALGARLLQSAEDNDDPDDYRVYADPAGHPFCICWVKPSTT